MSLSDIFRTYWWVFVGIAAILLFWIYLKLDISTKRILAKIFNKKVMLVLLVSIVWYLWYKWGEIVTVASANIWMPLFLCIALLAYTYTGQLKYETQQLWCANGFHCSYSKPPKNINGFLLFTGHSFNAGGISWDYGSPVVLREETCEFGDAGCVSIARPSPCSAGNYELPPEVVEEINNNRHLKGKGKEVYYGWFDDLARIDYEIDQLVRLDKLKGDTSTIFNLLKKELNVTNPKISTLYWLYKNQCKAINKQTEQYDSVVEAVEKGVEHNQRVKEAYDIKSNNNGQKIESHEEY